MGKAVFLDIDGTIRNFDGVIPESAVSAIRAARANGHKVCISTGRPMCQIEKRVLDIGFDGVISASGSYIEYDGKCIHHEYFEGEESRAMMEYLVNEGCLVEFQRFDGSYVLEAVMPLYSKLQERMLEEIRKFMPAGKKPEKLVDNLLTVKSMNDLGVVEKLLFFSDRITGPMLNERFGSIAQIVELKIPGQQLYGGELNPVSVDKAKGIRCILEAGGFSIEDSIAVGDSANDISMIRMAAVGVAMGNGTKETKEAADYVTTSLTEDGLKHAFLHLGLI